MVTKKKVATSKAVKGSKPKRVVKKVSPKKRRSLRAEAIINVVYVGLL